MAPQPAPASAHALEPLALRTPLPRAGWLAITLVVAVLVDAFWVPLSLRGLPVHGFELVSLGLLLWSIAQRGGPRTLEGWSTPFDGRIAAGLVMAVLQALPSEAGAPAREWVRQVSSCAIGYYALVALARGSGLRAEHLWRAMALATLALGAHALVAATGGLSQLAHEGERVDAAWASSHGLPKALAFVTMICAGRAFETGADSRWRMVTFVGVAGTLLHVAAGGFGLGSEALALLDDPLYFGSSIVTLLLVAGIVRLAWQLRRSRPHEARRWRVLAIGMASLGVIGVLGGTSGGEGLRVLAMMAVVLLVAAQEEPQPGSTGGGSVSAEAAPLARAA